MDTRETQHTPPPPSPQPQLCSVYLVSLIHPKERIPTSLSVSLPPPSPSLLFLSPLIQLSVQVFSSLEARWPLCSWCHSVWRVRTPARDKELVTSCQPVGPRGSYVTARNNLADCNPLRAASFSISSHPYGERKELLSISLSLATYLLLDVFAAATAGRHVHCTWEFR